MFDPYAIATARNLVASMGKELAPDRRHRHRFLDVDVVETPDELIRR